MLKPILTFLHLHLWRNLPQKARRAALFRLTAWWSPTITPAATAEEPIIIVGMLRHASGLGAAARACHDALNAAGLRVYAIDLTTRLLHEENYPAFSFDDGRQLLGKGTVLLHVSGPLVPMAIAYLGGTFVNQKRIIAHWFWELPQIPKDWLFAIPFIHEVWVNTNFVGHAVRPIARGRPVRVVPYPLSTSQSPKPARLLGHPFTALVVLNIASSFARKNPCAAIAAFRQAFGDDPSVRLVVKYLNAFSWPTGVQLLRAAAGNATNIELSGETLDEAGMDALYQQADVVISPHRAEGLGLVIAEAMLRGLPVIATNWSGSIDFLTTDTGVPVGYELVPVNDPQGNYAGESIMWANIDIREVAEKLQMLRNHPEWRRRLGTAAAAHATAFFHPTRYIRHVTENIRRPTTSSSPIENNDSRTVGSN